MGTYNLKPHREPPKDVSPSSQQWGGRTRRQIGGNFAQRARRMPGALTFPQCCAVGVHPTKALGSAMHWVCVRARPS